MVMVGITHELAKSLELLFFLTGMKDKAKDMHHRNQNKHAATQHVVTPEEHILLKNDLKWDLKLFDFVQQRFVRDYARFERIKSEKRNYMLERDMWLSPARQHWEEQAAISSAAFGSK